MERLTTDKPVSKMGMYEIAHNSCYVGEDGAARYRDFETDIDARAFAKNLLLASGYDDFPSNDDSFDEELLENLMYDPFTDDRGLIALVYRNLWAMADLRERLKQYEDLEEQLEKVYGKCDGLLKKCIEYLVKHEGAEIGQPYKSRLLTDEDVEKWYSYKDAEEQGLLVKLPCKVGDTIYRINQYAKEKVKSMRILQIRYGESYSGNTFLRIDAINDEDMGEFCYLKNDIGKRVFLTKEEAEAALEKMNSKV